MKCPYCGKTELGTGDVNGICYVCANKYNLNTFTGPNINKCDGCIEHRRRVAAEKMIIEPEALPQEGYLDMIEYKKDYDEWQSIIKEVGE